MPGKPSVYHLDQDDYVHVIQTTGSPIQGRFDNVDYVFEDGIPSDPVHWRVAHHIFGFRGTEAARVNAVHRLGWALRMDFNTAMDMLKKCVRFEPLELLPRGVLEFKKPDTNADEPVMPTAEPSSVGREAPGISASGGPPDPLRRAKRG